MKRTFDLLLALILLVPACMIVAVAAVMVRLETSGNPIFVQQRVGRRGQPFAMLKLRTMHSGTPARGSHEVGVAAITRVGAFLRSSKIDELPQIWSVLVGDMSFVGPRPCLMSQQDVIAERNKRGVYAALPGITGLAQLRGIDMSTPEELAICDADYVATRSFVSDLSLIAATATGRGFGDAATPKGKAEDRHSRASVEDKDS